MAYFRTAPAPGRRNLTAKNRVWDFFPMSSKTHPANRRQPAQPRRKTRPTPTKTVSGIPYWPARDPIGERGCLNLYGFVGNDGVDILDSLGLRTVKLPDGQLVDYEDLPPEGKIVADQLEAAERKLDELKQQQKEREEYNKIPPVEIIGEVEVTTVPIFQSEYHKCLYECMMNRGAIKIGYIGMSLAGFGTMYGVIPKPAGTRKMMNGKDITTILSKLQSEVNEMLKKKGLKPTQNIRQLGDKLSKVGDSSRWIAIGLMAYTNAAFVECTCECKDKDKTPRETR